MDNNRFYLYSICECSRRSSIRSWREPESIKYP